LLSLAINAPVLIGTIAHAVSTVTNLFVSLSVTTQFPVSQSINAVAHAQLISVPPIHAVNTVIALALVKSTELMTKWSVLRTTVSSFVVIVLIAVCILVATSAILVTPVKSIPVISLAVQSIVILNAQSVTLAQVA